MIAVYGKGGIGKSTVSCNLSIALANSFLHKIIPPRGPRSVL